jgi:hypothetical protein
MATTTKSRVVQLNVEPRTATELVTELRLSIAVPAGDKRGAVKHFPEKFLNVETSLPGAPRISLAASFATSLTILTEIPYCSHPVSGILFCPRRPHNNPCARRRRVMTFPGFTAESALYHPTRAYAGKAAHGFLASNTIAPALAVTFCKNVRPGWVIEATLCGECADFQLVCRKGAGCWWEQLTPWQSGCWSGEITAQ